MPIIAVKQKDERRCDVRCHRAKQKKCDCICGGRFHGISNRPGGVQEALKKVNKTFLKRIKFKGTVAQFKNWMMYGELFQDLPEVKNE